LCACPQVQKTPCLLFFFSSRRRHTRFSRDWSSDVCSSDLTAPFDPEFLRRPTTWAHLAYTGLVAAMVVSTRQSGVAYEPFRAQRSEERRVGKECRSRGSANHSKKKRRRGARHARAADSKTP